MRSEQDYLNRIAELEQQLEQARETNRRLNRRIQVADSQEGKAVRQLRHMAQEIMTLSGGIRDYYNRQRAFVKGVEQEYWRYHWGLIQEHLPRSTDAYYDSVESRIVEAGRRLRGGHPVLGWGRAALLDLLGRMFRAGRFSDDYRLTRRCGDKYLLRRRDFGEFERGSSYFVVRFDDEAPHGEASRKALRVYLSEMGELKEGWMDELRHQLEYYEGVVGGKRGN